MRFLQRDLTGDEVLSCEKIADKFIESDDFEIEIHNLNEVNEYFRIFKDKILQLQHSLKTGPLTEHKDFSNRSSDKKSSEFSAFKQRQIINEAYTSHEKTEKTLHVVNKD